MSYDILIGNAELESEWSADDADEITAEWVVKIRGAEGAPAFPYDFQPGANIRSPGYSQWSEFCEATGLYMLFYGIAVRDDKQHYGGILSSHPGIVPLMPIMLAVVSEARAKWEAANPGAIPGFDYVPMWMDRSKTHTDDGVRGRDGILARLLWLEWWMTWALANCERPAVYNR